MTDWLELSRRASFASHRLVGWIYWDPPAIERYAALGVPDGLGWYVASRAAPLGDAGDQVVTAAFYSINPDFVAMGLDLCRSHTTFAATAAVRDRAVVEGLRTHVPEICDELAAMGPALWAAADSLTPAGRVLFAAHRQWPRPDDPLASAWLAVNCIREWRGDTHWAIQISEDLGEVAVGILDGAWRGYEDGWLPRSRGADDDAIAAGLAELEARGLAEQGAVTEAGIAHRASLEDRLDRLCSAAWRDLGEDTTRRYLDLVEPVGERLMERIDETAGPNWMPAGRVRPLA
ncbi:MAG: hypothetical protein OES57_05290 [Acidimicrobiia bacterium]|nr:hypothetical protein [Acidimicrobiia bacterium]